MSCSRSGTGHLISYHARNKIPVADARDIYHDAIRAYVERERAKGHNPYEKVPEDEAVAFLHRQMRVIAGETPYGSQKSKHAMTAINGLLKRISTIGSGAEEGSTPPWVTRAEMHAVSHMPGLIASAERCDTCGRFMSPDLNHQCPTGQTTKANKRGAVIPADQSGTWGAPVPASMPVRTFGIETEFTNTTPEAALDATGWNIVEDESLTNSEPEDCFECEGSGEAKCGNCGGWGCPDCDDVGTFLCETCDGSGLMPPNAGEMVSPVLSGVQGLTQYREKLQALTASTPAYVDESCGIHVHVGAEDFTVPTMTRLMRLWRQHESSVFTLVHEERRATQFCHSLPSEYVSTVEREGKHVGIATAVQHLDRYKALNVQSFQQHGTVEYRLHHGSLDPDEVSEWAQFCVAFTEASARDAASDDLAHAEGIDEVLTALVRRDLLDRATAESLAARTGKLPADGSPDPDVEPVGTSAA